MDAIKAAWDAFMAATEVQPACQAYAELRSACSIGEDVKGMSGFRAIAEKTNTAPVSFRIKTLMKTLGANIDARAGLDKGARIVISGAGPVGLRAAVECALMGMDVIVLEKRSTFSRVNILTLFKQTADDLIGFGAKAFYPKFTNLGDRLHLGTREIQLVLVKNALLLGVGLSYGTTLVGVQAPAKDGASWNVWAKGGVSSHDFRHVPLSADDLKAADLAADEADELERLASTVPDVVGGSALVDLSEELAVISKGSVKEAMAALKRQSSSDVPPAPAAAKPTRKKALAMAAMFETSAPADAPEPSASKGAQGKGNDGKLDIGSLDFKPNKTAEYERGGNQGLCNFLQTSELDRSFATTAGAPPPDGAEAAYPFEALLLAEGEWSSTCKKLGVTKAIDRFSLAIGCVVNLELRDDDDVVKKLKSFVQSGGLGSEISKLMAAGIQCENMEFLKGETLYIAVTVKKVSLLSKGVLRQDLPGQQLLTRENVDDEALLKFARTVATLIGLPAATPFCGHHPAKLFDFSTRARCLAPFKVLATGTAADPGVVALDLSAHPFLAEAEGQWLVRNVDEATAEVEAKRDAIIALEAEIEAAAEQARINGQQLAEAAGVVATEEALDEAAVTATAHGRERREVLVRQLGVLHDKLRTAQADEAKWHAQLKLAHGAARHVPVFPVGDSLLEPFWPQGLGSNRGFHSALDAAHALRVLAEEGLHPALLDRQFSFDVMVHIGGAFPPSIIQPGAGWRADYTTRYRPECIQDMTVKYLNPNSKRLCKGQGAIPPWVQAFKDSGRLKKLSVELSR